MQFDFVHDDIRDHTSLDDAVYDYCESDRDSAPIMARFILEVVVAGAPDKLDQKFTNLEEAEELLDQYSDPDGDENSNLKKLLLWCWRQGTFKKIRCLKILRPMSAHQIQANWENSFRADEIIKLDMAYTRPFIGNAATDFVEFLRKTDKEVKSATSTVYAKAISVLQSSGMGKSRMLTEVGKQIFTLPICLRHPDSPGYPLSDQEVHSYFAKINMENNLSFHAHSAIAFFLAAAHGTMLKWLNDEQQLRKLNGGQLHEWWYGIMERKAERKMRCKFFSEVVDRANTLEYRMKCPEPNDKNEASKMFYRQTVDNLMNYLASLYPNKQPICVTYFDCAYELRTRFWNLLRLLSHQPMTTSMWYVFMGNTSITMSSFFGSAPRDLVPVLLGKGERKLLPPYIALDFDLNTLKGQVTTTIGQLQSLEHLARYGRPMWKAQFSEEDDEMVILAARKLTVGKVFNDRDADHVFAVLSQRLCIETVLVSPEAAALADRSVAGHMRVITGISDDHQTLYTYSPSEPILVLGAVFILYRPAENRLARVLGTFNKGLCSAGLVEKGLAGELGARILLLLARDFTAPVDWRGGRDLLKLVPLLAVIDTLFGNTTWPGTDEARMKYKDAFGTAHVNFTHWIVTKDPLPDIPDRNLLANLWARGAILQCCFNQESIEFLMVVYHGDIDAEVVFDPAMLSAVFGQVKLKNKADKAAEQAIRPIGLPRLPGPLPYLALLFELGNDSDHGATGSKIKVTAASSTTMEEFWILRQNVENAIDALECYQKEHKRRDPKLVEKVKQERQAMDAYSRYTIAVRGASASVYGILRKAEVEEEFATLLATTMPSPTAQDEMIQHMRPLERLGGESGHTA